MRLTISGTLERPRVSRRFGVSQRISVVLLVLGIVLLLLVGPAGAAAPTAKLIEIDVIKPGFAKGKPQQQANCSNAGTPSNTYALLSWKIGSNQGHFNPATTPSYLGSQTSALQASYNAWQGAPNVNVLTDGTGTRERANRLNEVMFGRAGGSLATTYTWGWSDGLIESDVVMNNSNVTWYNANTEGDGCDDLAGNRYDVRNIFTHEVGHIFGLGHPSGARYETMYAYGFSGETLKWSPTQGGDLAGIAAKY